MYYMTVASAFVPKYQEKNIDSFDSSLHFKLSKLNDIPSAVRELQPLNEMKSAMQLMHRCRLSAFSKISGTTLLVSQYLVTFLCGRTSGALKQNLSFRPGCPVIRASIVMC